jgi:poly-gamma-glutamate capsule biosynthesis protein CapA/YwtB (metallophosphatase superfamily)
MKTQPVTLLAAGDILIDRDEPNSIFRHVAGVLQKADITFANCEQMYSGTGTASPVHTTPNNPGNIEALRNAGFDVLSFANNHTMDWGPEALLDTMARLKQAGIPYVGVGENIVEARRPVILECNGTKVGFLAYGCTGPAGSEAEENKPGYAPVRVWTMYEQIDYQPGTPPNIVTVPHVKDLADMVEDVKKLRSKVDVAVVSFHWGQHFIPRVIPMYCFDVGHAAVDAGADIILGGHPHILKGIEVYKGKVIFYSLCNFALELTPEVWNSKGAPSKTKKIYNYVPDPECPNYPMPHESRATLIVKAAIENGDIRRVSFIPCYVNRNSEPEIVSRDDSRGQEVFNYVKDISASEGLAVRFSWDGDEVLVQE